MPEKRIYAYGQSNGVGMAYRLACDAEDIFSRAVAFEGAPPEGEWRPGYSCIPGEPISVLFHSTEDPIRVLRGPGGGRQSLQGRDGFR